MGAAAVSSCNRKETERVSSTCGDQGSSHHSALRGDRVSSQDRAQTAQPSGLDVTGAIRAVSGPDDGAAWFPNRSERWHRRVPGPQVPGMISTCTLVLGIWLVVCPILLRRTWSVPSLQDPLFDMVIGSGVVVLGLLRLIRRVSVVHATAFGCVLGMALVVAPLGVDYGLTSGSTFAVGNDVVVGVLISALAIAGYVDAGRRESACEPRCRSSHNRKEPGDSSSTRPSHS